MTAVVTQVVAPALTFAAIPRELRERPQWICWRWGERPPDGSKPPKFPYIAGTEYTAKSVCADKEHVGCSCAQKTWRPFEVAARAYERGGYAGVMFTLTADDPYTGLDFDHCRDPETGAIAPATLAEIFAFHSYSEISPSGDGVRVFIRAVMPGGKGHNRGGFEAYDRARFLSVTGQQLDGTPASIADAQPALDAFCVAHFPTRAMKKKVLEHQNVPLISASDTELLMRARNDPKSGARFCALFDRGDLAEFGGDHSRGDQALCNHLAYWCGPGSDGWIDSLFRQSALMREKWDRADYRTWTIDTALAGRTAFAVWRAPDEQESGNHAAQNQNVLRDPPLQDPPNDGPCCTHLEELAQLREALRLSEEANARLRARLAWDRELRAVTHVPPAHKLTLLAVQDIADARPTRPNEPAAEIPVYLPDIGKRCGRVTTEPETGELVGSGQTAGVHLGDCENYGILQYHVRRNPADGHTHSSVTPLPPMATPKAITAPPRASQGGKRDGAGRPKRCMSCGSVELVERTMVETVCQTCGDIARAQVGADRVVNVEPTTDAPPERQESGNSPQVNQNVLRDPVAPTPAEDPSTLWAGAAPLRASVADAEQHILTAAPMLPDVVEPALADLALQPGETDPLTYALRLSRDFGVPARVAVRLHASPGQAAQYVSRVNRELRAAQRQRQREAG